MATVFRDFFVWMIGFGCVAAIVLILLQRLSAATRPQEGETLGSAEEAARLKNRRLFAIVIILVNIGLVGPALYNLYRFLDARATYSSSTSNATGAGSSGSGDAVAGTLAPTPDPISRD